jgi:molybdopterin converting factor small subunit
VVNTEKETIMSTTIAKLLERLAEMFPKQNYQTRLDQYLNSKNIQSTAELDHWITQYEKNHERNFV